MSIKFQANNYVFHVKLMLQVEHLIAHSQWKCNGKGMRNNKVRIRPQRWYERDMSYPILFV